MILITGGAGYIGAHIGNLLQRNGHQVVVVDDLSTGHREFVGNATFYRHDLAETQALRSIFKSNPISTVIHCAASAIVAESCADPIAYYQNNVSNTLSLIQVMREFNVKLMVFSSSCAIYGTPGQSPIGEGVAKKPESPYGRSKWMVEQILEDACRYSGFRAIALRYFNAAGADSAANIGENRKTETHLIPRLLKSAASGKPLADVYGTDYPTPDGTCIRDYIHVSDVANAHLLAISQLEKQPGFEAYNLGLGRGYSVLEVIAACEHATGQKFDVRKLARRAGDPAGLWSDPTRAQRVLGWKPVYTDLASIVETAWKWHQKVRQ